MTVKDRHSGLGRGLAALIPQRPAAAGATEIPIDRIVGSPFQPRSRIDEDALASLVESIRVHGVIQPILVSETLEGYQLVAGERRLRAAKLAGLDTIPAVIRQLAERDQLELALVENVQREDLNAMEEARAYRQLIDEFGLTQEEIGRRVSRSRSSVANVLRLLDLAPAVQHALEADAITEGHARALAGLDHEGQRHLLDVIVSRGASVRQVEDLARRLRDGQAPAPAAQPVATAAASANAEWERVVTDLRNALGTKVTLARGRRGGRIVIEYYSDEELGRLYERLVAGAS
jgi:ParB family chromosome partitioning protein